MTLLLQAGGDVARSGFVSGQEIGTRKEDTPHSGREEGEIAAMASRVLKEDVPLRERADGGGMVRNSQVTRASSRSGGNNMYHH
ncbi:hypothetical protein CI109_104680 [Kwoniella shandongensis]|uniref:Uncharacterized protein n=1 Tax=Kwoniella shandongensis TaxID=1734106 RepID=A0AAJ8LN89_9TREE